MEPSASHHVLIRELLQGINWRYVVTIPTWNGVASAIKLMATLAFRASKRSLLQKCKVDGLAIRAKYCLTYIEAEHLR